MTFQRVKNLVYFLYILLILNSLWACSDTSGPGNMNVAGTTMQVAGEMSGGTGSGGIVFNGGTDIVTECSVVGENLGLCAVCGPLLSPIMPPNDENCPYLACETLTQFQSMNTDDGGRVCLQYVADQPVTSCKDLGACYETPEEDCILNPTPMPLLTVYPGCGEFTGCDGDISPDGSQKPEGAECHSLGVCGSDGRCSAPAACQGIQPEYVQEYCRDDSALDQCDKYIDLNGTQNADQINCTIACATAGQCTKAWRSNGGCSRGGEISCNERARQLICRCAPASF